MSQTDVVTIIREAVTTLLLVSAPLLGVALVVGVVISIIQATTQINEQSVVFVSKIIAMMLSLLIFGPWMLNTLMDFTSRLFDYINLMMK